MGIFSALARLFSRPPPPEPIVQNSALGPLVFSHAFGEWGTVEDAPIYHGGIPGNADGPDQEKVAEMLDRRGRVEQYWTICGSELLEIASCYASLPRVQDPRQLFRVAALSLDEDNWEICFETKPEYKWLYIGFQFQDEVWISNTIDT